MAIWRGTKHAAVSSSNRPGADYSTMQLIKDHLRHSAVIGVINPPSPDLTSSYHGLDINWTHKFLCDVVMYNVTQFHPAVPCALQGCTLGSPLDATSRSGRIGHYLDLDQPATCSGKLVAWHFCYYANTVSPGSVLAITFRVWRPQEGNR